MASGEPARAELGVVEAKLRAPRRRDGTLARIALLERLDAAADRVVVLRAPAGYGKSTLLRQWVEHDGRPFAWVTIDGGDEDPVVLFRHIVWAIHRVVPLRRAWTIATAPRGLDPQVVLAAIAADLADAAAPFVLVLDDVHELSGDPSFDLLDRFLDVVPRGSSIMLATRADPGVRRTRRLLAGTLLELGVDDLRFDAVDSAAVLRAARPDLDDATVALACARCDGWPAALALVGLALDGAAEPRDIVVGLSDADQPIAEYLRDEVLRRLAPEERTFLVRTAVLERLSGPVCDVVLETSGSHDVLESLASSGNVFVAGFDDGGAWYRYHHLWRELLLAELRSARPDDEPELRRRAAAWLDGHGLVDDAIGQYLDAGDRARAVALAVREIATCVLGGRTVTLARRLNRFDPGEVRADPGLGLLAVWVATLTGDADGVGHASARLDEFPLDALLADGTTLEVGRAGLEMLTGSGGTKGTLLAADVLVEHGPDANRWWSTARLMGVIVRYVAGEVEDPAGAFRAAERDVAADPALRALALAHRVVLELRAQSSATAQDLIVQAWEVLEAAGLDDYPPLAMVHAADALAAATRRDGDAARGAVQRTEVLLERAVTLAPRGRLHVNLVLTEALCRLGDVPAARARLRVATVLVAQETDAVVLSQWADDLADRLRSGSADGLVVELTVAERRVLEQLPTHRSLREIAELLYVSRNTVKTQTMSVYRKLGVSSRSDAVVRARELGLLEP